MKTLVIGSCDVDVFITPKVTSSFSQENDSISFHLGDKIPININQMSLGGNGSNVSVALKRLGAESYFYTYLGTDLFSELIHSSLEKEGVQLVKHKGFGDNNSVSLIFDFSSDRIIFSHHEVRNHVFQLSTEDTFEALYVTSIGKEWKEAYRQIVSYTHSNSLTVAFSPGSPQFADLNDIVYELIAGSEILFVNKEEGEKLLSYKEEKAENEKELLHKLSKLGPRIVSVTDGENGAYAYSKDTYYFIPPFDTDVLGIDKTGAGDAYASSFFACILQGMDIKNAMLWGSINSNSVMQKIGAQPGLLTRDEIEEELKSHEGYCAKVI